MNIHVALSNYLSESKKTKVKVDANISGLYQAIEIVFGVAKEDLKQKMKTEFLVEARQAFCYVARHDLRYSFRIISEEFNQHHSTVMYAVEAFEDRCAQDLKNVKAKLAAIRKIMLT